MELVICGVSGNSRYTPSSIQREAREVARAAHLRLARYWVEITKDGRTLLRCELRARTGTIITNHVL